MSIKVLVADDSITIQKVIGIIFGGDEYSLTVVDNGKSAVDKAIEITPDILLIDALMPGMTGYEVSETVRSIPSLSCKPILILTGSFEPFDEEKARKCGADDFIAKPFESQQIISKVKELLVTGRERELKSQSAPATVAETPVQPIQPAVNAAPPAAPSITPPAPQQVEQPAAPADIWGAFTPEIEQPQQTFSEEKPAPALEPDVFAIVNEESDTEIIQSSSKTVSPTHTGSQWVPVEESTFEFGETVATPPASVFTEEAFTVAEPSFADIAFEETPLTPPPAFTAPEPAFTAPEPAFTAPEPAFTAPEPAFTAPEPAFTEPEPAFAPPAGDIADFSAVSQEFVLPVTPPEPFTPLADPTPILNHTAVAPAPEIPAVTKTKDTLPTAISEEQLKAALASASKDLIERIVWEVVPDLAEAMIREAIRKIKEGV
ncbi:MAG: response regulator [Desulfuromonadaceae bacterium]|nr:response regulator [Desulfuromonadaceae bacterium]